MADLVCSDDAALLPGKSSSAPSTPTETSRAIHGGTFRGKAGRRVNFPSDDSIVTGYFEAPDPWCTVPYPTTDNLVEAYRQACDKQAVRPLAKIVKQLQGVTCFGERVTDFNLKGERLDSRHCETLEEVFKRVQFKHLNLESTFLDDEGAAAMFDMIEYYESATHLTISCNKHVDMRGWQACSRMLKKTSCLQHLDVHNTILNEQTLLILGRALRLGSHLVTLHLENCGINGRSLVILVAALKLNTKLRDLFLGENKISPTDGIQIGNLLKANTWLETLDLRGNHLQDTGVSHIAEGLSQQPSGPGDGLKALILCNNQITATGIKHLTQALLAAQSLKQLNLGHNNVANEGVHHLKPALMCSRSLIYLGLKNAKVTCEGAVALAEYLADNCHIRRLDLRENDIQVAGVMALALSMKHNLSVIRLDLDSCPKEDMGNEDGMKDHEKLLKEISEYCSRNKQQKGDQEDEFERFLDSPEHSQPTSQPLFNGIFRARSPVISIHLSSFASRASEKHSSSAPATVEAANRHNMNSSVSSPPVTSNQPGSYSPASPDPNLAKNRFRVSRVFLEKETEKTNPSNEPSSAGGSKAVAPLNGMKVVIPGQQGEANAQHKDSGPSVAKTSTDGNANVPERPPALMRSQSEMGPPRLHSSGRSTSAGRFSIALVTESKESVAESVRKATKHLADERQCASLDSSVTEPLSHNAATSSKASKYNPAVSSILKSPHSNQEGGYAMEDHVDLVDEDSDVNFDTCSQSSTQSLPYYALSSNNALSNKDGEFDEEMSFDDLYESPAGSDVQRSNKEKPKKLAFLLPELPESPHRMRKNRRMSTPAMPTSSVLHRPKNLNLKLCRQLESLDLRSSVPLSPTRLMEGWEFPEPMEFRFSLDRESSPSPSFGSSTANPKSEPVTIKS